MYLYNWQRTLVFDLIPGLKKNKTVYFKQKINNPDLLECWNFFIRFKKVRQLTYMFKATKDINLISLEGKNPLEIALDLQYFPLLKCVLEKNGKVLLLTKDNENISILNRIWASKFNIYKHLLLFIKSNNLESFFSQEHMLLLINCEVEKMVFFEKTFPGLFLKIYPHKIDNLHPKFQYVLLQHDILKKRLSQKFKPKNEKKIIVKI